MCSTKAIALQSKKNETDADKLLLDLRVMGFRAAGISEFIAPDLRRPQFRDIRATIRRYLDAGIDVYGWVTTGISPENMRKKSDAPIPWVTLVPDYRRCVLIDLRKEKVSNV